MKNTKYLVCKWNEYSFGFICKDGKWWLMLKDISDALGIRYEEACRCVNPLHSTNAISINDGTTHVVVDCCGMYSVAVKTPYIEDDSAMLAWIDMTFHYLETVGEDANIPEYVSFRKVVQHK